MGDLQPGVRDETQQSALGHPTATGAGLQLMAVLDELHDDQAVYLDNLNTGVILRVLPRVSARVRHLQTISLVHGMSKDSCRVHNLKVGTSRCKSFIIISIIIITVLF